MLLDSAADARPADLSSFRPHRHRPGGIQEGSSAGTTAADEAEEVGGEAEENGGGGEALAPHSSGMRVAGGQLRPVGPQRLSRLTYAISALLDDFTMVAFLPLNIKVGDRLPHAPAWLLAVVTSAGRRSGGGGGVARKLSRLPRHCCSWLWPEGGGAASRAAHTALLGSARSLSPQQDEESIALVLGAAQQLTQYGEDREPREGAYGGFEE